MIKALGPLPSMLAGPVPVTPGGGQVKETAGPSGYAELRDRYFLHIQACMECDIKPGYRVSYLTLNPCLKALALLALISSAFGQVPSTCTKNNGKPCAEWVHTMVGQYPPDSWPTREESEKAKVTGFFHFRGDWRTPALRNTKLSWALFIGSHVGLGLTFAIDHHITHGVREDNGSEIPAILGVTALDFMMFKCFSPAMSVEGPIYGMQHYARDAAR